MNSFHKLAIGLISTLLVQTTAWSAEMTIPNTFTSGSKAIAAEVNANFSAAKSAVDDNNTRITALEDKSPAMGRLLIPVAGVTGAGATQSASSGAASLPDAVSSGAHGSNFPKPDDYIDGEVTVKAVIGGCGGSDIAHETGGPSVSSINIGANSSLIAVLACTNNASCATASIPASGSLFTFSTIEVSRTLTSLGDINTPHFTRHGAEANDSCTTALTVYAFIVEYPRG